MVAQSFFMQIRPQQASKVDNLLHILPGTLYYWNEFGISYDFFFVSTVEIPIEALVGFLYQEISSNEIYVQSIQATEDGFFVVFDIDVYSNTFEDDTSLIQIKRPIIGRTNSG